VERRKVRRFAVYQAARTDVRMFLGQFYHNLDDKGRLTIPARYRELLPRFTYVMQGFERNLMVFPSPVFETIKQHISQMSMTDPKARLLRRMLYSTADQLEVDRAGRILIPQFLRQFANLNSSVVVVGNGDYFEIWSPDIWSEQRTMLEDVQANSERFVTFLLASD